MKKNATASRSTLNPQTNLRLSNETRLLARHAAIDEGVGLATFVERAILAYVAAASAAPRKAKGKAS